MRSDLDVDVEMKTIEDEGKTLLVKPTFVTASEQIRSVEAITGNDQTPTDILNDNPGPAVGDDSAGGNKNGKTKTVEKPVTKATAVRASEKVVMSQG